MKNTFFNLRLTYCYKWSKVMYYQQPGRISENLGKISIKPMATLILSLVYPLKRIVGPLQTNKAVSSKLNDNDF